MHASILSYLLPVDGANIEDHGILTAVRGTWFDASASIVALKRLQSMSTLSLGLLSSVNWIP